MGSNKGHVFTGYDRTKVVSVDIDAYDIPNFVRADATKPLPFRDKEFDCAVLAEIIEHVKEPVSAIKEAGRVAKQVLISVPYEHKWTSDLKPFAPSAGEQAEQRQISKEDLAREGNPAAKEFYKEDDMEHLWHQDYYTPAKLREHIKLAGLEIKEIYELRSDDWVWLGAICESVV